MDLPYRARRAVATVLTGVILAASLAVAGMVIIAAGWWAPIILLAWAGIMWLVPFWYQFFLGTGPEHPWFWLRWWLAPLWRWAERDERYDGPTPGEESVFDAAPRPHRALSGEVEPPRRW